MTGPRDPGGGRRLIDVLTDAHVATRARLAPLEAAVRAKATEAQMEAWERDLSVVNRRLIAGLFPDGNIPADLQSHVDRMTGTDHQIDFVVNILTAAMSVFAIAGAIQAGGIEELRTMSYHHHPTVPLTPAELATAAQRGILDNEAAAEEALLSGTANHRFLTLLDLAGVPPGAQDLLQAYRRGLINRERLDHGIRQGNIRNEWIDVIEALRYQPPGAAAAIEAAVQNHLPDGEARTKAEEAGLDPANFDWMYQLAGNPPGVEHMIDLMHRGALTRAQVEQGMRESRLKNKYIQPMIDGGWHLPPMRTVISLGHKGILSKEEVIRKLLQLGFHQDDAAAMAQEATADKLAGAKDLARGQVVAGYEERFFDRPTAVTHLIGLGYDAEEAGFLLDLADHDREKKFTTAAVGRFHTLYVRRRIDKTAVSSALDTLGIPAGQRDDLLTLWDLERTADTPDLTTAQWQGLFRRNVISEDRFVSEMLKKGWSDEEAGFLKFLAFPPGQSTVGP